MENIVFQPGANGGKLQVGNPGNRGNPNAKGAVPSELREQLRGSFAQRLKTLEDFADGKCVVRMKLPDGTETETMISADVTDRLRALDMLAKYGLGTVKDVSVEAVRDRVVATLDIIRRRCPEELAVQIIDEMRPIWA